MAAQKSQIVIKKITVVAGGAHGGAWKVAFADFMTAMMAFFLVMWLLATASEQTKKAISDYFSTPSVIEYEFNNFGAQLTLEKLFLDLVNEPLKVFQAFINPMDRTPNVMAMGMKKVVLAHLKNELGAVASFIDVQPDSVTFEIPDSVLFRKGLPIPGPRFAEVMSKVKGITSGSEDSDITITSVVYNEMMPQGASQAAGLAEERLDILQMQVKGALESETVTVRGIADPIPKPKSGLPPGDNTGLIRIEIHQRGVKADGTPTQPLKGAFEKAPAAQKSAKERTSYDDFLDKRFPHGSKE